MKDFVETRIGELVMSIESIRDNASDIGEPDVPCEEVLNSDLIGGR